MAAAMSTPTPRIPLRIRRRSRISCKCYRSLPFPAALTWYLGRTVKNQGHGWAVWAAMFVLFLAGRAHLLARVKPQAIRTLPNLALIRADGNMEGKEVRFGIFNSALFATITTDASCGAVNSMHDSFTPLGGLIPLFEYRSSAKSSSAVSARVSTACSSTW